jgi:hypothetical protein
MGVESNIKARLKWCIVGVFVVLAILVGLLQALESTIGLFLIWKAYGWFKLHQFWKKESAQSKLTIEYVTKRLNEGAASNNLWIRYLATPETRGISSTVRVQLMAAAKVLEAKGENAEQSWTAWASEGLDDDIEAFYDTLMDRLNVGRVPTTVFGLVTQQVDLQFDIARHALTSLGVADPEARLGNAVDKCIEAIYKTRAQRLTTFINEHLDVPSRNTSPWVQHLRQPENQEFGRQYRTILIERARELQLDILLTNQIKRWREWGATRIEEHVLDREDDLSRDIAPGGSIISSYDLMMNRAAFEVVVAEEALRILGVLDPRAVISTMALRRSEYRLAVYGDGESPKLDYVAVNSQEFEREMLWFMARKLAKRAKSESLWVRALACDQMNTQQPSYPERVLAGERQGRSTGLSDIEAWRLWGATRIEANFLDLAEDTLISRAAIKNLKKASKRELLTARVAFEKSVAEHALALLDIPDPCAAIKFCEIDRGLNRATDRAIRTLSEIEQQHGQSYSVTT